ncbi:MAG: SurA N-terminal domain-containing protein [Proteobacteria bacterium]|nr:SurA N-terminal domain-containing protein [Pseudomonadota bacterium]
MVVLLFLAACSAPPAPLDLVVARVGETSLSLADFESRFLISRMGGDPEELAEPESRNLARKKFLAQLVEEMLVLERARELGIRPDPARLEKAVADVSEGYPPGAFEGVFARQAVRESAWMRALECRLLVEELIGREVEPKVQVADEEIAAFLERKMDVYALTSSFEPPPESQAQWEAAGRELFRQKKEDAYRKWLSELKERYVIEIHRERLE